MPEAARDLLAFIDASPTPYHAVAEATRRLRAAGYAECAEQELWSLAPGDRRFVVRHGGSLVAFAIGSESPVDAGFRIVGAHTDSPNLRLKPCSDTCAQGYRQLAVEPYGGLLLHTWLDRDLSIAGRVTLRDGGALLTVLLDFDRPLARVPSLAIHLNRDLKEKGLQLNAQTHSLPLVGLEDAPALAPLLATELRAQAVADVAPDAILAFDLMLYDAQPAAIIGADGALLVAPRLDNLASCHAAVSALVHDGARMDLGRATRAIVLYDHEEVGSESVEGAGGNLLVETLERIVAAFKGGAAQGLARARARSRVVSADMAHAVHPNFADKHEPGHKPVLGRGPVIKSNVNQSYATDAVTAAEFAELCAGAGVVPQRFSSRNDQPCGSTIGPITASRTGIPTVDVGNPMLSMHSCRELAGTADVAPMIRVLQAFFAGAS
ncbi:MAG: M18 family aminopeptidase [Deltaproteobacteria bacterium]|nr:M18 family aminopeptidase [Deltaproteobacteria bacterium]